MPIQTVTRTAETDHDVQAIYSLLAEPTNIPKWAPVFADKMEHVDGTTYRATKNGETFSLDVLLYPDAGAADYIREMPNNRRGGAYIRVTPRPMGGSTVTMTVPLAPDASEAEVGKTVEDELAKLIGLAGG